MTPLAAKPAAARNFFLAVAIYFALQIVVRLLLGGSVELDEAEQFVMTQEWHWGYEVQPPLYTWLQAGVFAVLGVNLFAFALLKNALLFSVCATVYAAVRAMTGEVRAAIAAAAGMFLLPQFVWEAQRDQTHSVLATMLAAATLWRFVRASQQPTVGNYLWFGAVAALGCLSKYNFAIFLVTLLVTAGLLPEFRPALLRARAGWSVAIFVALTTPHAVWMAAHRTTVLARAGEVHVAAPGYFTALGASLGSLVTAVVAFSGLAVAGYAILFSRAPVVTPETPVTAQSRRLVTRLLVVGGWLCLALALFFQARFKDRWMSPLLFLTPIFLTLLCQARLDELRLKRLLAVTASIGAVVLTVLLVTPFWAAATGHYRYLNPAYAELAQAIKARGFERGVVLASDRKIGGNLRLTFRDSVISGANYPPVATPRDVPAVVVWAADRDGGQTPPAGLTNVVWRLRGVELAAGVASELVTIPREHTTEQPVKFGFTLLPPALSTKTVVPPR